MAEYRIDREKVRNRLLLALLEVKGISSLHAAGRISGIDKALWSRVLNGKYVSDKALRKIASFLVEKKLPELDE